MVITAAAVVPLVQPGPVAVKISVFILFIYFFLPDMLLKTDSKAKVGLLLLTINLSVQSNILSI